MRTRRFRSGLVWIAAVGLIAVLAAGVVVLDRRQAARGAPPLLALGGEWLGVRAAPGGHPPAPARRITAAARGGAGRVAVIIDGLGERADVFAEIAALGRPVTVAVVPGLPLSPRIARETARAGLEVLLQVPLEPYRYPEADPGPGALLVSMAPEEIARRTRRALQALPEATGVMTRMGSRFTEDGPRMGALLEVARTQGLFFVDSQTTPRSVGYDLARQVGLRAARRQLFLDPDDREATVRARLAEVPRWVERRGTVIAVGHGRLLTVRLLQEAIPQWEARGLRLVPVSDLLDAPAPPPSR